MERTEAGKILVVDDEKATADAFREILEDLGYAVECDYSAAGGLKQLEQDDSFFLVISDLRLGEKSGIDLIQEARKIHGDIYTIIITAYGSISSAVDAMKLGINDYLSKPVDFERLKLTVNNLAEKYLLLKENIDLKSRIFGTYAFRNIVGKSRQMQEVFRMAAKVSRTNATVLLRGESGTGKGLMARAIHFNSPRKDQPLVEINCAALPDNLLESELFGHRKGAFTGAITNRKGRFEDAGEGTVFLDEIGDMGVNLQAKLLRVLQEKTFEPLGSNKPVKLRARIIASTNRHLEKAVRNGTFREDLYYRLNVVPIYLPPLRERPDDILLLAAFFLEKYCRENNFPPRKFSPQAMDTLFQYSWPGNIRELENLIERMVIIVEKAVITDSDLFALKRGLSADAQEVRTGNMPKLMAEYEKKIIRKALSTTDGNRTGAARLLNISLRQLQYKIKKHHLS